MSRMPVDWPNDVSPHVRTVPVHFCWDHTSLRRSVPIRYIPYWWGGGADVMLG
jgi:hypothetical protein